ncbi:PepSY-associated TM helix domain-containing protein [Colwellia maritima]|uniref:PepSY-associated TM helix domain-containing protein n=1 Tax=Colwellia maritima TaxID=2912588 RepID=UPI0030840FEB
MVLGVAAVLYFLALVSGIIFLLPTLTKSFFALRKNKGANRFWLDSHNLIGVISLPFHIIIAITVVVFAFHDAFYGGLSVGYGERPLFEQPQKSTMAYSIKHLPTMNTYLKKVSELTDGYEVQSMAFSGLNSARPSVGITIMNTQEMMRNSAGDFIYMNPYTFEVTFSSIPMNAADVYTPLISSFFSLHFGGYGGDLGRWLYFIMGLLGAFLFYSGNLLWLEKRRQKHAQQTKPNRFMASLTIGVCLGSVLAVTTTLLSSKWLYLTGVQTNNYYLCCYYVVFFIAFSYAFASGAAKSAINLLYLMSLACLFIPLTTLLTLFIPSMGLWETRQVASIMVELVAFVFSGIFYYAACKTKHRAYYGERNSIWALSSTIQPYEDKKTVLL